ncbi:protein FAM43A-like isoform X2 [Varroa jacobsoni]|uniref:PID domain-containing protein n=1 Tax=Varroa destructor TaxID=109461 RepID=A0A7M7KP24_VARDE|nr:protein FAM43A-like [Varroa destructor]XP_022692468.1 protein FAM43A-like isoform X2 [Varroa jacobsoni]
MLLTTNEDVLPQLPLLPSSGLGHCMLTSLPKLSTLSSLHSLGTFGMLSVIFGRGGRSKSVAISEADPTYKCVYLGNVITPWAKNIDAAAATLWNNHVRRQHTQGSNVTQMKVSLTRQGVKAWTSQHGLTEYWASRITHCSAAPQDNYPHMFCWVYRHESGQRAFKQELRCHAVLCSKAGQMETQLRQRLHDALQEFRREKMAAQRARLSTGQANVRRQMLSTGSSNYRRPRILKLDSIEEAFEEPMIECCTDISQLHSLTLTSSSSTNGGGTLVLDDLDDIQERDDDLQQLQQADNVSQESGCS